MVIAGNCWDRLAIGYIYSFGEIAVRTIMLLVLVGGLIAAAHGRILGALLVSVSWLFWVVHAWTTTPDGAATQIGLLFTGLAVAHVVTIVAYSWLARAGTPSAV